MRACASLSLLLGGFERVFERRELAAQRGDLLVEQLDLRQRARGDALLRRRAATRKLALPGRCRSPAPSLTPLSRSRSALGGREVRAQRGERVLEVGLADLFQRQQLGELGDLRVEPLQRGVLAGHFLRQEELHHHEHREQEDDAEEQRRQRVDEARPVVDAAFAARAGERHVYLTVLRRSSLRGSSPAMRSSRRLHLAALRGLGVGPVADHLLLGAHVADQALDRLGEIGHRGGRGAVRAGLGDRLLQPLDRAAHLARRRGRHRGARLGVDRRDRARWSRASPPAPCRSGSAPGSSAGRGSRARASRRGRTARTRTRCPCR